MDSNSNSKGGQIFDGSYRSFLKVLQPAEKVIGNAVLGLKRSDRTLTNLSHPLEIILSAVLELKNCSISEAALPPSLIK
jgi:hypothetical protein